MKKNFLEREHFYFLKVIMDGILLAGSFLFIYYVKRSSLEIDPRFKGFLILLMGAWLVSTIFSKKFMQIKDEDYFNQLKPFLVSAIVLTFLVSMGIYILGWYQLSRFIVYGTIAMFLVQDNVYLSLRNYRLWKIGVIKYIPFSVVFFMIELFIISVTFILIYRYHTGTIQLKDNYMVLLMGLFFIWFMASLLIHKFEIKMNEKYLNVIFPFWKSELIIIGLMAYFIVLLNLAMFSRFIILGSFLAFAIFENIIVTLYFFKRRPRSIETVSSSFFRTPEVQYEPERAIQKSRIQITDKYAVPESHIRSPLLKKQLQKVYLLKYGDVFQFIEDIVDLSKPEISQSAFFYTRNPYNFDILADNSLQFFINLRKINDYRRINYNLIIINQKLKRGGVYVGCFEGKKQCQERIRSTYPLVLARILLGLNFLFRRVIPRLPLVNKLYFFITKGRGRAVSKAEALGRLVFCGFEILALDEIDHQTWFVVKKVRSPNGDKNPSYGPLFKQKRVGKNKKFIFMYKLRTMHPYSEYLHDFMLENYPLGESGKIKEDFRLTGWGRFLRKLYMDELPMLLNWLKRDVKLVGVRPLSESFFKTYPEDLQKERIKYKPGLIPPYYADMPGGMEEVWKSEREYLKKYRKHPWRTDITYFFKAMNNIFFHHAKSS